MRVAIEHRHLLAEETRTLHTSAAKALAALWKLAAPTSAPPAAIDPEKNGGAVGIGTALTDTAPLPVPVLRAL